MAHTVQFVCPVAVAHQRLHALRQSQLQHHHQHIGLHGNAHGCYRVVAVRLQEDIDQHVGNAHQQTVNGGRQSNGNDPAGNAAPHPIAAGADG